MRRRKKTTDAVRGAQLLGLTRATVGAALVVAPGLSARVWLGEEPTARARVALRGLGAREIGLGIGLLTALETGNPVRGWLEAGALSDAADSIFAFGSGALPAPQRIIAALSAGASAVFGLQLAEELD